MGYYAFCIIFQRLLLIPHGKLNKKAKRFLIERSFAHCGITYNILTDYINQLGHFVHTNELVEKVILLEAGVDENAHTFNDQHGGDE